LDIAALDSTIYLSVLGPVCTSTACFPVETTCDKPMVLHQHKNVFKMYAA